MHAALLHGSQLSFSFREFFLTFAATNKYVRLGYSNAIRGNNLID